MLGEAFQFVEGGGPLDGGLAGSVGVVCTSIMLMGMLVTYHEYDLPNVETLPVGCCEWQRCRKGSDRGRETHRERCVLEDSKNMVTLNGRRGRRKQGIEVLRVQSSSG